MEISIQKGVDGKAGHGLGHGHGRGHGHEHGHLNQTCMRVHQAIQPGSSTCLVVVVNFYLTREVSSASAGPPESPKTYMYRTHKLWILRSTLARKVQVNN